MNQKILCTVFALALGLGLSTISWAASEHGHGEMKKDDHGGMGHHEMDHSEHMGNEIHEATVEGYTFAYHLIDMAEKMKGMKGMAGMDMSKMKSHHLMVYIMGPDGKQIEDAKVGYKVEGPAGEQKSMAMGMKGGYGADVDLKKEGRYEIKTKAVMGEKTLTDEFKYDVR